MPENPEKEGKELRKNYINPDNIRADFINDMTVSHSESEFFLSFWRTEPPTIFRPEDLEGLEEVDTVLVAKVVVSPMFAERIIKAMQKNLKEYESRKGKK